MLGGSVRIGSTAVLHWKVIALARAGPTQYRVIVRDFAVKVDPFTAFATGDAFAFVTRQIFWLHFNPDVLEVKQLFIRHFAIGEHLLLILRCDLGMSSARGLFRGFLRGNSDRAS